MASSSARIIASDVEASSRAASRMTCGAEGQRRSSLRKPSRAPARSPTRGATSSNSDGGPAALTSGCSKIVAISLSRSPASAALRATRGDGELSRERILQSALRLFAEQGYAKTSIRQIAQGAQANVAAIGYYFGDKAGLYRAIYCGQPQAAGTPRDALANEPGAAAPSLALLFEQFLEPLKRGDEVRLWMKLHRREMLEPTGLWEEKLENGIRPMHNALVALLCARLALPRPDDEVRRLAIVIAGLAVHLYLGQDAVSELAPQLFRNVRAIDVSDAGDWSLVKVWYAPQGGLGTSSYPTDGFIYGDHADSVAPVVIANKGDGADETRLANLAIASAAAAPVRGAITLSN